MAGLDGLGRNRRALRIPAAPELLFGDGLPVPE